MPDVVFHGVGTVWDAARSRVLCRFTDGSYKTSDPREVEILSGLGYTHDLPPPEAPEETLLGEVEEPMKRPRGRPRNA